MRSIALDRARRDEIEVDRVAALRGSTRVEVDDRTVVAALAVDQHEDMHARKTAQTGGARQAVERRAAHRRRLEGRHELGQRIAQLHAAAELPDILARKSVVEGRSLSVRVDPGGCRTIKKKKNMKK